MKELDDIDNSVKSVVKRGIGDEIQKLLSFLKNLLSMLTKESEPALSEAKPAAQPEKPAPRAIDPVYAGLMRERRSANREFAWKKDGPLKDSY